MRQPYHARNRMGGLHVRRSRLVSLLRAAGTGYIAISRTINRGGHEIYVVVFTTHHRTVSARASPRHGAADADAGGKAVAGAAAAECGILRAARDIGRPDHRRSLAGGGDRVRKPGRPRHLFGRADQGLARSGRCRSRQGRRDLPAALACRPRLAFLVPARRRVAGGAFGGADSARVEDGNGGRQVDDL